MNARGDECKGMGTLVMERKKGSGGPRREVVCQRCGRLIGVNYDGTLRRHVKQLKR